MVAEHGPIAQWQSTRLITAWLQVRILLGPLAGVNTNAHPICLCSLHASPSPYGRKHTEQLR